jgi:hypothetical protein
VIHGFKRNSNLTRYLMVLSPLEAKENSIPTI